MPKKAKAAKPQAPKLPKGEAEQVRIRREVGHDFALRDDAFGRKRLAAGTAEARRVYEVSNDGYTSTGGIVRVRNVDPLIGITSLSRQQREAGQRYRDDFQCSQQAGVKPMRWSERIGGGAARAAASPTACSTPAGRTPPPPGRWATGRSRRWCDKCVARGSQSKLWRSRPARGAMW